MANVLLNAASTTLKQQVKNSNAAVNDAVNTSANNTQNDTGYGATDASPVDKLANAMSDAVGATTELVSTISSIQSGRDLLNVGYGFLPPGLGQLPCFVDLAAGILTFSTQTNDEDKKLLAAMSKPFKDAFSLFKDIVLPGDDSSLADSISSFFSEGWDSLSNPFMLFLQQQGVMLDSSLQSFANQFDANQQGTFFNDFKNNVGSALQKLFLGPDAEGNLLGIFIYAFQYGIPSIDAELYALRQMKKLAVQVGEDASNAPIKINFQLPNSATVTDLCEAEEALRIAYEKMATNNQLDRPMLSYAAKMVCEAKSIIYDGSVGHDFVKRHAENYLGIGPGSTFKAGDISIGKMLPAATFKAKIDRITRLANQIKSQDDQIVILYNNILKAVDNIKAITNVHIGKLLAPLILFVKNAVSGVRRDLELTGMGQDKDTATFEYDSPVYDTAGNVIGSEKKTTTDPVVFTDAVKTAALVQNPNLTAAEIRKVQDAAVQQAYKGDGTGAAYDIWSYMSAQTNAYIWLTILCRIMQLLPGTFNFIDKIISGESVVMRVIEKIVEQFNVGVCKGTTDPTRGGQRVVAQVNDLIRAAQNRFAGLPGAQQQIATATKELRLAITDRQKFLVCMKQHMFFGLNQLMAVFSMIADAAALLANLKDIIKAVAGLITTIKNLSLDDLFGDSTSVGLIIKGIKCLVASCDSPVLNTLSVEVLDRIEPEAQRDESKSTSMKSFDGAPKVAAKVDFNQRIAKIIKLVQMVNDIMNMNFNDLCTDDEKAKKKNMAANLTAANTPVNASSQAFYVYDAQKNQAAAFSGSPTGTK